MNTTNDSGVVVNRPASLPTAICDALTRWECAGLHGIAPLT
jgi:hypothetical protein